MRIMLKATYVRIFLISFIMFTIAIIPFSLFLSNRFSHFAYSQVESFNHEKMNMVLERSEYALTKLKSFSLNLYENQSVQNWIYSVHEDPVMDMDALQVLSKNLSSEPFVENAYLLNMRKEKAIDYAIGQFSFAEFGDKAILDRVSKNRPEFLQFFNHVIGNKSYLALIVPSTPNRKEYYGYLVVLLNKEKLQTHLLGNSVHNGSHVAIADGSGQLVLGGNGEGMLGQFYDMRKNARDSSFELSNEGIQWFVNYADMSSQPWTVYTYTEMKEFRENASSFQNTIVICSLALLTVLLIAAFWNSRRYFKPFRNLADQLQRKLGLLAGDEYVVIERGVELLRNHFPLIKTEYLRQWLLQGRLNESAKEAISRESKLLAYDDIRLAVIKLDSYFTVSEQYDFGSRKLLKYAMGNIAEELLLRPGRAVEAVDLGGDHVALLIGTGDPDDDIVKELNAVRRQIEQNVRLHVTIAVSEARRVHDDLRKVYDDVCELTMYKFIRGDEKIYTEQDFETYVELSRPLPDDELLDELIQSVRGGKEDKAVELLDRIFTKLQTMKYTECQFQLKLIFFAIIKSFSKLTSIDSIEGIENYFKQFSTLGEIRDWLKSELLRIISMLGSQRTLNRKDKMVEEIVEYVRYHVHDPMLSVEDIADHVSLSAKYVRKLFTDTRGISLSNFILNARIDKVKELLEKTELPVADISEQSGFQTKSHFFTAFKKATGMTPTQYRQDMQETTQEAAQDQTLRDPMKTGVSEPKTAGLAAQREG